MMETTAKRDKTTGDGHPIARVEWEHARMIDYEVLERMSLEELLYYVLVGDGRRLKAEPM